MFSVKIDQNAIDRAKLLLSQIPKGAETALSRAINRTIQSARTEIVKVVRERYTLKSSEIRNSFTIVKANKDTLTGEIRSKGSRLNAARFSHKPGGDTTGNKRQPVTVAFTKGKRFKVDRGFVYQGNIYKRQGKARLPISPMLGPSIPHLIGNQENIEKIESNMTETFNKRLNHELEVVLKGFDK